MHQSVLDFGRANLTTELVTGVRVIEIGSLNVNGSLRPLVEAFAPADYIGVDLQEGPGVDLVEDVCRLFDVWHGIFGLVICAEMLEHARDWRQAIRNMKWVLAPGGTILLTTRSIGFARHYEHPGDFWRFSVDDMRAIFADFTIEALLPDPGGSGGGPGVFLRAVKPLESRPEVFLQGIEVYSMENEK